MEAICRKFPNLGNFYPEKVEGTIPTIKEIEARLSETEQENK